VKRVAAFLLAVACAATQAADAAAGGAAAVVDSVVAAQAPHTRADSLAVAAVLDSAALSWPVDGTDAGFAIAESLLVRGLALRTRILGRSTLPVASSLDHLAGLRFNRGDYDGALAPRSECLEIRTRLLPADHPSIAEAQRDLATNLAALGRYGEARPLLEAARATLERAPERDDAGLVNLLTTLGEFRRIENRYDEAESCLVQAIRLARATFPPGDPFIAYPINNLAGVYRDQGRFDAAEPLLRESFAIHAAVEPVDLLALADATLNRAELARFQGRSSEAESLYVRALSTAEQALGPDDPTLVWFLNQYGVLHRERGAWARAARLSRRSLAILERAGGDEPLLAQVLVDLAEVSRLQGRRRDAEAHVRRAIALREKTYGRDHPEVALALVVQARCRAGRLDAASDSILARALHILDAAPAYPEARVDALALRAARHTARGARAEAIQDLETALGLVETLRRRRGGDDARAGFVSGHARLYEDLTRLRVATGDIDAAFAVVERGRARVFQEQWAAARVDLAADVDSSVRASLDRRMHDARLQIDSYQNQMGMMAARADLAAAERTARLARLGRERDRWVVELDRSEDELRRASPRWRALAQSASRPATAVHVAREAAPRDGIVLVYALGEVGSWVFAIADTSTRARCFPLVADARAATALGLAAAGPLRAADVERIVAALDLWTPPRQVAQRGIGGVRASGAPDAERAQEVRLHAAWRVLVPPRLRAEVLAAQAAIVVPDGALHALPFEALIVEAPARDWLAAGPVLRYAASATALVEMQRARTAPTAERTSEPTAAPEIVSIAAPVFGRGRGALANRALDPLPGTAREADAVRAAFAPAPVATLTGALATEAGLRAALPQARFVHIATHGIVERDRDALLAGLALAPGATRGVAAHEDDGFLQLYEIDRLRLDSELVVLSACETSAGALVAGEGMFALSRGFMAAGARRVVASLWQVEDESTAALVAGLFRRLAAAERDARAIDIAVALRDAKREVRARSSWQQPFYWAGFVLSGAR
jgi:CHAT domain-containing protein/tetratricopeptide (TPR) repeat protein